MVIGTRPAIEKHARGDVEALARGIIEELRAAGLEIRRIDEIPNAIRGGERGTHCLCSACMGPIEIRETMALQANFGDEAGSDFATRFATPALSRQIRSAIKSLK